MSNRRKLVPKVFVPLVIAFMGLAAGVALALPACAADLTRDQAKAILDKKLAATGTVTRDVPLGPGMHIGLTSAGDFGAPIRSDMMPVSRELETREFIQVFAAALVSTDRHLQEDRQGDHRHSNHQTGCRGRGGVRMDLPPRIRHRRTGSKDPSGQHASRPTLPNRRDGIHAPVALRRWLAGDAERSRLM